MILILPIIAVVVIGLILYYIRTKNQERLKLIEKGINPDGQSIVEFRKQTSLKNAVLFISLSLGLFLGHLLTISFEQLDDFIKTISGHIKIPNQILQAQKYPAQID
ncbi:MAG: DUF6249 domain-containing protein [Bacteroidota bacterium]